MSPRKGTSPARIRLEELLADGQWHGRETLIEQLMPLVPPGRASRAAEEERTRHHPAPLTRIQPADTVRVGARHIAMKVINRAIERGYAERRHGVGIEIRKAPR